VLVIVAVVIYRQPNGVKSISSQRHSSTTAR
jgi:hypothetical protein